MSQKQQVTTAATQLRAAAFLLAGHPTLGEALRAAKASLQVAGLDTPRLDAEVLLAHALDISRTALLARLKDPLPAGARETFATLIDRRLRHEPIAYLTDHQAFYGLDFHVDHRVLIPRPETELLVDRAIETADYGLWIADCRPRIHNSQLNIADVGTGSGCIAIALAVHLSQARVYAVEASPEALEVARINVQRHGVSDRVRLVRSNLLGNLNPELRFDIIVANLPYVSEPELADLPRSVRDYEPVDWTLAAGPDGLDWIRQLLHQAPARLHRGGVVLLEIGWQQGPAVSALVRQQFPDADVRVWPDLAGHDRVVEIRTEGAW